MEVFGCAGCGTELTGPVSRLALPDHARSHRGCGAGLLPPLLPPGTYAVDAEPDTAATEPDLTEPPMDMAGGWSPVWGQVSEHPRTRPARVEGWDEPEPDLPTRRFTPDRDVFLHVLARLPQVREPWFLAVHEDVSRKPSLL